MENIVGYIILIATAGVAAAIMMLTHRTEKRGCGHGCATCPNRSICHKTGKKEERSERRRETFP